MTDAPDDGERDPDNRLLARQSRFRVDAEWSAISRCRFRGCWSEDFGGPSVKPYQPEGYYDAELPEAGVLGEPRRGSLSAWSLHVLAEVVPASDLTTFDAPTREECTVNRTNSNTPLQALVLLNDPIASTGRRAGATEVWSVTNNMAFPHNFHVHDVQFQVLDIAGNPPPAALAGWKIPSTCAPTSYRLIMRFTDYADPDHPYMYHCHLLRHEDSGMMASSSL